MKKIAVLIALFAAGCSGGIAKIESCKCIDCDCGPEYSGNFCGAADCPNQKVRDGHATRAESDAVQSRRNEAFMEAQVASLEKEMEGVRSDVAELKEATSITGVKIDRLFQIVSEIHRPIEATWEACGDGVMPDQTEVPPPSPMPAKVPDDAITDLQKRVAELETSKAIFGNVVLMANDAKVAADEEHKEIRKQIKDLEGKVNDLKMD